MVYYKKMKWLSLQNLAYLWMFWIFVYLFIETKLNYITILLKQDTEAVIGIFVF